MFRKFAILTAALTMMFMVVGSHDAQAQCTTRDYNGNIVISTGCLDYDLVAPKATPTPRPTPKPTSSAVVSADTVAATTGSGSSGGASIAFTGSESRVLGYAGAGLIGLGALALVAARRRSETSID